MTDAHIQDPSVETPGLDSDEVGSVPRLPGSVESAPPGQKGFDTNARVTATVAKEFAVSGYKFAIRYVSREANEKAADLNHDEALGILNSGLALMAVQHVEGPHWKPPAALGTKYGTTAAAHMAAIGFPERVNVWLDLEEVAKGTPVQHIIDYCNNWSAAVSAKHFEPGLYVGSNSGLNGDQLSKLKFTHFWKSESTVPPVPGRGYQLIQKPEKSVHGLEHLLDITQDDEMKGAVQWLRVRK